MVASLCLCVISLFRQFPGDMARRKDEKKRHAKRRNNEKTPHENHTHTHTKNNNNNEITPVRQDEITKSTLRIDH